MSMYMNERQCARADFDELQERFVLEELCESEVSGSRCRRGESRRNGECSERGERERCERGERREHCERCGCCGCNMGSGCWIRQDFRPAGPVVDGFQPIEQPMCNRCGCGCGCNGGCGCTAGANEGCGCGCGCNGSGCGCTAGGSEGCGCACNRRSRSRCC